MSARCWVCKDGEFYNAFVRSTVWVDYRIPFGGYKLFEIGHELGEYAHDILSPSGISM